MLTVNQEVELFKNFALKHKGINTFYFGDEWETSLGENINYPLMIATPQGTTISNGNVTRNYLIIISDLVNLDESNETQVLSDIELTCMDLPNYLRQVSNSGLVGALTVTKDLSLTDFTERGKDSVTGYFFDLSITTHIGNYSCNLPIAEGNILDDNYIYVGGNMPLGNFVVEIKDQDGNVLQTFTTSGEYLVTVLTGIKDTITANQTNIIDNII
jgi:hypothetical protein